MDERLFEEFYAIEDWFWWSVATRRAFMGALAGLPLDTMRVVDLGCGAGVLLAEWPRGPGLRVGCDLAPAALALTRRRGVRDLVRTDALALPFRSGSVDLVLTLDVIEHLDDDVGALREVRRVLVPGGHVLVHVPAFPFLWTDKDDLTHHRRRYWRRELLATIRAAELEPVHVGYLCAALMPAALARAAWQRLVPPPPEQALAAVAQLYRPPALLNRTLTALLSAESRLSRWLPFGTSLLCLARRPAA